jgi:lipopolysaccharide transport system ATP-binding protein
MQKPIIEVKQLSKNYRLGVLGSQSFKDDFQRLIGRLRGVKQKPTPTKTNIGKSIAALNEVSFSVQPGELVGMIGGNGAGKSTLLKILSRITEPTRGEAILRGRVASLLEVGTGFHPDLSGRENIFLNASILGMRKEETQQKLDEIIAFSEIEKFIDTPIKRYSSGMRVRLAFAVAAFLEPDILIVDEVLAVGDENFQQKCIGKMNHVSKHGRTILFVSHDLAAIQNLCERVLVFRHGKLTYDGKPADAIRHYLSEISTQSQSPPQTSNEPAPGIQSISVSQGSGTVENLLITGKPAEFRIQIGDIDTQAWCELEIYHESGALISRISSKGFQLSASKSLLCIMSPLLLSPGRYRMAGSIIAYDEIQHHSEYLGEFTVHLGTDKGNQPIENQRSSLVQLPHTWSMEPYDGSRNLKTDRKKTLIKT